MITQLLLTLFGKKISRNSRAMKKVVWGGLNSKIYNAQTQIEGMANFRQNLISGLR